MSRRKLVWIAVLVCAVAGALAGVFWRRREAVVQDDRGEVHDSQDLGYTDGAEPDAR